MNFAQLYIGNSHSELLGVVSRLGSHYRGTGNTCVKMALAQGVKLWFVSLPGHEIAGYETIYLHIQGAFRFPFNARPELIRYLLSMGRLMDAEGLWPVNPLDYGPS